MSTKPIEIIVAATPRGEIGYRNTIPWRLKGDLRRFKELTMGNIVVMGKRTYESLPGPLEGRIVIIVSASMFKYSDYVEDEVHIVRSLAEAIELGQAMRRGSKIFIAGGVRNYEEALLWSNITVQLTTVFQEHELGYDAIISNFFLLDNFELVGEPETVYFQGTDQVSHAYSTMRGPKCLLKPLLEAATKVASNPVNSYQK